MIFVSAGHYPSKPGASYERFVEHDEAMIWASLLVHDIGRDAVLVPTGILKDKVAFINERTLEGDIALEIHFNAALNKEGVNVGRGSETLYYPGSEAGKSLAELCQKVLAVFFPPDRGAKEGWYRMNPNNGPDFFLAKTKCPAVILEPEFVHHAELIREKRVDVIDHLALELQGFMKELSDG